MKTKIMVLIASSIITLVTSTFAMEEPEKKLAPESQIALFGTVKPDTVLSGQNLEPVLKSCLVGCNFTMLAIDAFLAQKFELFNPNVGDSACQIRASQLLDICNQTNSEEFETIYDALKTEQSKLKALTTLASDKKNKQRGTLCRKSVSSLFTENNIEPVYIPKLQLLGLSYFLTDISKDWDTFDKDALKKEYNLSTNATNTLRRKAQDQLQQMSITYMQQKAADMALQQKSLFLNPVLLPELANGMHQIDGSDGRKGIPCLFGIQTILESMAQDESPLIIKCKTVCSNGFHKKTLVYMFDQDSGSFLLQPTAKKPGLVFNGLQSSESYDQIKEKIPQMQPCNDGSCSTFNTLFTPLASANMPLLLLANAAFHPQFCGDRTGKTKTINFEQLPNLKQEFDRLNATALTKGACYSNMSSFLIDHIQIGTQKINAEKDTNE